jgi:hypothetical protein
MSTVRGVGQGRIDRRVVRCQSAIPPALAPIATEPREARNEGDPPPSKATFHIIYPVREQATIVRILVISVSPFYINGKYFFQNLRRWPLVAAIVHSLVPDMH